MATNLTHIQLSPQSVGIVAKACASTLGFKNLKNRIKGKDCECETIDLKYLIRAQKEIICYHEPGSVSNAGSLNQSTILFPNDNYGFVSISILSSDGLLNGTVIAAYTDVEKAVASLIDVYIDTAAYPTTEYLNPSGETVFNIIAPDSVYCGVTYTITIVAKDANHPNIVRTGTFSGGQCIVTDDDNCITVNEANQIIENINGICGGLCSCQEFYTDSDLIE